MRVTLLRSGAGARRARRTPRRPDVTAFSSTWIGLRCADSRERGAAAALRSMAVRRGAHHSPRYNAYFECFDAFRALETAKQLDGVQVDRVPERPAMIDVAQDVCKQRRRSLVTRRAEGGGVHDRLAGLSSAAGESLFEHAVCAFGADVQDGANRLTLHLRLAVAEQLGELRQCLAPTELAQEYRWPFA